MNYAYELDTVVSQIYKSVKDLLKNFFVYREC